MISIIYKMVIHISVVRSVFIIFYDDFMIPHTELETLEIKMGISELIFTDIHRSKAL